MNQHYKAYDNEFNKNYSFIEGFSSNNKKNNDLTKTIPTTSVTTTPVTTASQATSPVTTTPVTTTPVTTTSPSSTVKPATTTTPTTTNTKSNVALEGFDLLGFEDTMKRGKQSNSIFVSNKYSMNDDVMPYDHSMFSY